MLENLKNEMNLTNTENGAVSFKSTNSYCLDLFATIGALRFASDEEILNRFIRAYTEDADTAMKILFFARDVRGGLGERKVFRTILKCLSFHETKSAEKNIRYIAEYGRYDDLLVLLDTPCQDNAITYIKNQLETDLNNMENGEEISLLAKWLPSVNASSKQTVIYAKKVAKLLGMNGAEYRKMLSKLRSYIKIIENNLREKDYTFDYSKQPSKALFKYRQAFFRNDKERYNNFLTQVNNGEAEMNTGTLMPYEIIAPLCDWYNDSITDEQRVAIDTTWNALEDFCVEENAIAVIDGSGSMYGYGNPKPIQVALSLGIYFAEHNKGAFANHFITFSEKPQLVEIKGRDIADKVNFCKTFCEVANTNIQKVFELILNTALKNNVPQNELPSTIYIISDMEFDCCTENADLTNFEYAKKLFEDNGYTLPTVIFWNVQSRNTQQPVKMNSQGVALVSGCTPKIFNMVTSGNLDPYSFMLDTINNERYKNIVA